MDIASILTECTLNFTTGIASNAAYDFFKRFAGKQSLSRDELEQAVSEFLLLNGAKVNAATAINFMVQKGYLNVQASNVFAATSLSVEAATGAKFTIGSNSSLKTEKTAIVTGKGASISGSGSGIVQNPDGSISFMVGTSKK